MQQRLNIGIVVTFFFVTVQLWGTALAANETEYTIEFYVYNRGLEQWVQLTGNDSEFAANGCDPDGQFAMFVPGWRGGLDDPWVVGMLPKLATHREGCILYLHYGNSEEKYLRELFPKFNLLVDRLTEHFRRLEQVGFDPAKGFIFGYSFGAHMALEAARRFGFRKIGRMDICEPARVGFEKDIEFQLLDPKLAAKKVQCIHTSSDLGTLKRSCHIDWNMGNCGNEQLAAKPYPLGSHGLCPYFYTSAFEYKFYANPKPAACYSQKYATRWPRGLKMGYYCDMDSEVNGELFSPTTKTYPYTYETLLENKECAKC